MMPCDEASAAILLRLLLVDIMAGACGMVTEAKASEKPASSHA